MNKRVKVRIEKLPNKKYKVTIENNNGGEEFITKTQKEAQKIIDKVLAYDY